MAIFHIQKITFRRLGDKSRKSKGDIFLNDTDQTKNFSVADKYRERYSFEWPCVCMFIPEIDKMIDR